MLKKLLTSEEHHSKVSLMKEGEVCKSKQSAKFCVWMEKTWLPVQEVWVISECLVTIAIIRDPARV